MPNQDNKVVLVNTFIEGGRSENSSSEFDIIVLSQDKDVNDTGRVIAVQNGGGVAGYNHDLVSYAYVVKGSDTSLTISGNYGLNGTAQKEYVIHYWSSSSNQMGTFSETHNAPNSVTLPVLVNALHFAYNNDDRGDNVAGAIKFNGDNTLVLTAQAGSATANYYWHAQGFDENSNKLLKTDDAITIYSYNFGIYSPWDNEDGDKKYVYGTYKGGPSKPGANVYNYTIHSDGDKLTVKSDLVGEIRSTVAALHTGYYVKNSDPKKGPIATDDSSSNKVEAAGVKAQNLVLESNFRADVRAENNAAALTEGLKNSSAEKKQVYEWTIQEITTESGGKEKQVVKSDKYVTVSGTTFAGFASPTADNNKVNSYGVVVDEDITLEDGVWSGEVYAEASDIAFIAEYKNTALVERGGVKASATGNVVGAYGIKASTINIDKMGALYKDYNGVQASGKYNSSITAVANNIKVSATSIGKLEEKDGKSTYGATSANVSVSIVAAAIYATTVNIGEMTSEFELVARSTGHSAEAIIGSNHEDNTGDLDASAMVYGIYGVDVNFGIFNGSITAESDLSFKHYYWEEFDLNRESPARSAATGIAAQNLTATRKFAGSIDATHIGIYTNETFTVTGVISTDISSSVVGINVAGSMTADAFAGKIYGQDITYDVAMFSFTEEVLAVGISVSGKIASNNSASGDAFDISGSISVVGTDWSKKYVEKAKDVQVQGTAITSAEALNLRISGTVDAGIYTAINAESWCDKKQWYFVPGVKHNDKVELSSTAVVKGDINLGQLLNQIIINSSATFDGVVFADGGSVNTTFVLDDVTNSRAAYVVREYKSGDTLIKGSQLININMSYATNGKYELIQYQYHKFTDDTGVEQNSLWKYWQNNEFQLLYLDKAYNVKFDTTVGSLHSGSVAIQDNEGHTATFTVIYDESKDALSIEVNKDADFSALPKKLDVASSAATYVTTTANEGAFTIDWSELDAYLKANIESTLSGEDTYGLEKVTNYQLRYKFVDAAGNAIPVTDGDTTRIWTNLEFYQVNGTSMTIDNAPEGAEDVVWEITPIDDTVTAVESKDAKKKLVTSTDSGNLVLSWSNLDAADVGLVDFNSIDLVEIVYTLYDKNGKVVGSKNQSKFITAAEFNTGSYTFESEATRINWELKFHDVVEAELNDNDFAFNVDSEVKSYTQQYDAEKSQLTIDWKELHNSLTQDGGLAEFNFANGILNYEIEYQLYDETYDPTNPEASKIGKTVVVTLDKNTYTHTFNGVEEKTHLAWRIRIVGNETGGLVSQWSDWNEVDVELLPSEGFDFSNFGSSVRSVYSTIADEAVPNSIAELEWKGLVSAEAVRCYEIEYCRRVDQVTLAEAQAAGYASVAEYIASDEFYASADVVYSKIVSGKTVVLSNLKNNGYVYWRIRAIDETANLSAALNGTNLNGVSEWAAGATFCVHQNGESIDPDMQKGQKLGYYVDVDKPLTFDGKADIDGYLCWNAAIEQDSGMSDYVVEFRNQNGEVVATKTVQAADAQSRCIGQWELGEGILLGDYTAEIAGENGDIDVKTKVIEYQVEVELSDGTVEMQTKYKTVLHFTTNIDLTGKTISFSNGTDTWQVEVYDKDTNPSGFAFQKYDYELSLDDVDVDFDPSKGYSFTITATDNFSNSGDKSIIIGSIDVDNNGPIFVDSNEHGHFITDDRPSNPETDTLLNGYICWNGAFDGETDVRRYVLALVDDNGKIIVDRNGSECIEVIDQTDDPTTVAPVPRSIVTYVAEDLTMDGVYTVLDAQGNALSCTLREVTVTDENGESSVKVELLITGEGNLIGSTITVNGQTVGITADNCKYYAFSVDLGQWNLDAPRYTYNIYAEDSLGNKSPVVMSDKFILDDEAPVFEDRLSEAVKFDDLVVPDNLLDSSTYSVRLGWQSASDDYGVKQYIIKLDDGNGSVIEKTVSRIDAADDYAIAIYRSEKLVLGEEYTVTVTFEDGHTEEFSVVASENSVFAGNAINNGIGGTDLNGVKYLSWSMDGVFTGNETITIRLGNSEIVSGVAGSTANTNDKFQYANYGNSYEITGLTSGKYDYTIYAEDFFGELTRIPVAGTLVYDKTAPVYLNYTNDVAWETVITEGENGEKVGSIVPTFTWSAAEDIKGGVGMRCYVVQYCAVGSDEWTTLTEIAHVDGQDVYTFKCPENMAVGLYEYRITALDNLGNGVVLTGSFGAANIQPLAGSFDPVKKNVSVKTVKDSQGELVSSSVTLSWDFSGDATYYRVIVASDANFSDAKIFWTTAAEAAAMQMVFDNSTIGRPSDIFDSVGTLYWKVDAYDAYYNMATESFGVASHRFTEAEAFASSATAKPVGVEIITASQVNDVNTDEIGIKWISPNEKSGVYYFTVQLLSEDGSIELHSGTTLSVDPDDHLSADIDPKIVKIVKSGNYNTLTISDLRKFFGVSSIADGKYKVVVNAFDAQGICSSSEATGLIVDTTRPGMVQLKNAQALTINRGDLTNNELIIEWESVADLSDVDYYEVKYRVEGTTDWSVRTVRGTRFTVEVNSNNANTRFEYRITAVDCSGNRGIEWAENGLLESVPDSFFDTLEHAKDMVADLGWAHGENFVISNESVGCGDAADTFKLVTTYGRTISLTAGDLEQLLGSNANVKVEIFAGNDLVSMGSYTFSGSGASWDGIELQAGTTYVFKVTNADESNTSASRYNITLTETDKAVDLSYFNVEQFTSSVKDASGDASGDVVSDEALISWSGITAGNAIESYEIKYVILDRQYNGADIADYINGLTEGVVTCNVSGENCTVSFGNNTGYVYWVIRAKDEAGNESAWNVGSNFFVSPVADSEAPDVSKVSTAVTHLTFDKPAADDTASATKVNGKITWQAASDNLSGIKEYIVEISSNNGETYSEFGRVSATDITGDITKVAWQNNDLNLSEVYTITFDGVVYTGKVESRSGIKTLVWDGDGNWIGQNAVITGGGKSWNLTLTNNNCSINVYNYAVELNGLSGSNYKYRIQAVDFTGNPSGYIYGKEIITDLGAPIFFEKSGTVEVANNENNTAIVPTISWNAAADVAGDLGVRYYEVYVVAVNQQNDVVSNWGEAVLVQSENGSASYSAELSALNLKPGNYQYKVVAYDYFGNSAEISGSFSTPDTVAPIGNFTGFKTSVKANYRSEELLTPKYDSEGKPVLNSNKEQVYDSVVYKYLIDAEVVIDWSDNFGGDAVHYKVAISNDPDFAEGSELYSFWTTAEEAAATQMVFSADTTGRPVGIFENMNTVYYRVYAYDASYNKSAASSGLQSFAFYDENYGSKITEGAAAVPQNVKVNTKNMVNNCHTDVVGLSWTTSGSQLGVYYYEVELLDAKGKVIATASTLDDLSDKLATDSKNATSYYNMTVANGSTTVAISDLKKFFGWSTLEDGNYKVRVNAYSASGKKKSSKEESFVVDTQRPDPVKVTNYSMIPSGAGEDQLNVLMVEWEKAVNPSEIAAYEVYYRVEGANTWECCRIENGNATSIMALPKDQWPEVNFTSVDQSCEFYVIAIDKQGNVSELQGSNFSVAMTEDKFANLRDRAQELVNSSGEVFADADRMEVGDIVGIGDLNDYFIVTTDNAAALTLTVSSLSAAFTGANDDIKITIYEGTSTRAWKTVSVKDAARLFTDLLLKADTTYTFCVSSAGGNKAASQYNIVLDKKELPADTNNSMTVEDAAEFNNNEVNRGWVGFGDTADYYLLQLDDSGKYSFTLDGMAASTKLSIYEAGSKKAIISVTGTEKNVNGVTTKEVLLDKNKTYYVEVVATNAQAYGSDYNVTMNTLASYPGSAAGDNSISGDTPAIGVNDTVAGEWVGFGDSCDYRVLNVGANGGVVNFTIEHRANMDEAVKMVVYQYTGDAKTPYKAVKTITLAKNAAVASTGNLFLTGATGGVYYVEVVAPGSAKGQNSAYELTTNGYIITDDMVSDTANNIIDNAEQIELGVPVADRWVGISDTVDNYAIAISAAGAYEFQLDNVNGKEIKVALVYVDAKGKKVIKSVNGTAGADDLILSLDITEDMIAKAAGNFYLQVEANGKNANSQYTLTVSKNSDLFAGDGENIGVDERFEGWVGLGDNVNYIDLDITESGFYDLGVLGAENPLKAQLVEVDANGKTKSVKSISLTAVNSNGAISGVFLDKDKTYRVEITATGAAKGQNSNYSVNLTSHMGTLDGNRADGTVSDADTIAAYTYEVHAGVYSFVLNNINGNSIKMSVIDAATGKVVKTITPAAKSDSADVSLKFDADGTYIVKLESAGKGKTSNYALEVIEREADSNNELGSAVTLSTAQAESGWVGLGDATDYYQLDLSASGTGVYSLELNGLDNNAKITIYENGKAIKNVTGSAAKAGVLNGLLLKDSAEYQYHVGVQAAQANGTKDTYYTLTLTQTSRSQLDNDAMINPSEDGVNNWVGFGDASDYYTFTASDVNNITLNLNGVEQGDVKIIISTLNGTKVTTVKTLTANSKTLNVSSGDLCLTAGQDYNVEVIATNANKGVNADYVLDIHQWNFADYETGSELDDNVISGATEFVGTSGVNAVWSGDNVDYFKVVVAEDGSYTLSADLLTLNGNAVKLSLGTEKNGKFTALQSVTGKAGTDELLLSRNLTAGTYYIKVESNGKNSAAEYELELVNNSSRVNFSNDDDTWKQVAAEVEDNTFGVGTLSNWVGFGDAVDVFELKFDQNGVVTFDWNDGAAYGDDALFSKEITLTLVDANGKSVALTFDKVNGSYTSNNVLMADVEYYLSVKHNKPAQSNIDYKIDVTLA